MDLVKRKGNAAVKQQSLLVKDISMNLEIYLLFIPVILYYVIFCYYPMYGSIMAFKNFVPKNGILGSDWVGLKQFMRFFQSPYFFRVIKNTLMIGVSGIVFSFPVPIILSLLLNELKSRRFCKVVQTVTYLPHFISMVVICSMIREFTSDHGIVTSLISVFTGVNGNLLNVPEYFVPIYIISGIWQNVGWDSIIYLAALTAIDQELYEAAKIDGANKWRQTLHITLPGIIPTIIIMLILRLGNIVSVGYEKIILLYNPVIYETSDVISSYVYRMGLQEFDYSFSAAVGLFNSAINFLFLFTANYISRKYSEISLW